MASYGQDNDSKYKFYSSIHDMFPKLDNVSIGFTLDMLNQTKTRIFSDLFYENGNLWRVL